MVYHNVVQYTVQSLPGGADLTCSPHPASVALITPTPSLIPTFSAVRIQSDYPDLSVGNSLAFNQLILCWDSYTQVSIRPSYAWLLSYKKSIPSITYIHSIPGAPTRPVNPIPLHSGLVVSPHKSQSKPRPAGRQERQGVIQAVPIVQNLVLLSLSLVSLPTLVSPIFSPLRDPVFAPVPTHLQDSPHYYHSPPFPARTYAQATVRHFIFSLVSEE